MTTQQVADLSKLSAQQERLLTHVRMAEADRRGAQTALETTIAHRDAAVYDAVTAGVAVRLVADLLGVSIGRIYQIKDTVAKHRT